MVRCGRANFIRAGKLTETKYHRKMNSCLPKTSSGSTQLAQDSCNMRYTTSSYVVDFKCALNSGEAQGFLVNQIQIYAKGIFLGSETARLIGEVGYAPKV